MKKAFKIFGIILLIIVVLVAVLFTFISKKPVVSDDYSSKVQSGGRIEERYLAIGSHDVSYWEQSVMQDFDKYEVYYPSDISEGTTKYPVVIFSNGTGVFGSKYPAVLKHLASWGFIVMATEEENSWSGLSSELCLRTIILLNESEAIEGWADNPFYGHVDVSNIGVSGHSQGGVGVISAATAMEHGNMITAIFAASPTNLTLAKGLQWDYDPSLVTAPIFMVSGTGNADENLVVSGQQLADIFNIIPDNVTKIMARRTGADHPDMLTFADGYMTAWFMWRLQGDEEAYKAFTGDDAELLNNTLYQDQKIHISE